MSEKWTIGDLAQCIYAKDWHPNGAERPPDIGSFAESLFFPAIGQISRVYDVAIWGPHVHLGEDEGDLCYIRIDGFVPFFDARLFRKVAPSDKLVSDRVEIAALTDQPEQVPA